MQKFASPETAAWPLTKKETDPAPNTSRCYGVEAAINLRRIGRDGDKQTSNVTCRNEPRPALTKGFVQKFGKTGTGALKLALDNRPGLLLVSVGPIT